MDKFFEKVARLSSVVKLAVLFATVAVIFGVFIFLILGTGGGKGGEEVEQAKLKAARKALKQAQQTNEQKMVDCDKLKQDFDRARKKMRRFEGMLPDDPAISSLIKDIKSKLSGLSLVEFTRQPDERKRVYAVIPLDLKVVGSFHKLLRFFHEISIMPRIVNISDVALTEPKTVDGKSCLTVSFRVSTFRYLKKRRQPKAAKEKKT